MSKAGKIGLSPFVIASVWLAISALLLLGTVPRVELISFWALLSVFSVVLPTFCCSAFDGWKSRSAIVHLLSLGWSVFGVVKSQANARCSNNNGDYVKQT